MNNNLSEEDMIKLKNKIEVFGGFVMVISIMTFLVLII